MVTKAKVCGGKTMSNNSKHDRSFSLSLGVCGREVDTYWTKWIQQSPSLPLFYLYWLPWSQTLALLVLQILKNNVKNKQHTHSVRTEYLTYSSKLEYKWNYQKSKEKGLRRIPGCWWDVAQWYSMFLACLCPWVQSSEPPSPPQTHTYLKITRVSYHNQGLGKPKLKSVDACLY